MIAPLRCTLGLSLLVTLACEVSTSSTRPEARPADPAAPSAQGSAAAPAPADPGPPPEPPWPTAAGLAYREVILGDAGPEDPLPMIVAIHGLGDHPDNFVHLLDHDGFPEPVRVILPRGLDPVPEGGYSWFPLRARNPDVEALSLGIRQAADRIAEGVRVLSQSRPTLGKPVVTGFSQGGMLTFTLAVHHPDVVGHAVVVGGWLPPPLVPAAPSAGAAKPAFPPIVALHGTADAAVPFPPTQAAVQALVERGIATELLTYEGAGHMITEPMRRDLHDRLIDAVLAERRRSSP